ncbi:hypothetical protein AVDCRST_MAG81-3427 [uncultured Synechococcales cyanobacterium]|uniref:HNH domain-containing protein n=1 Tax=uncultured Synechococcales cyanobacterium TaxID=1936017 RepID=A0A6J4VPJ6_9CYAN|nr:hypothetical protein AVDCRST_MAG81-3427 [uncultured Synechococcales cyanobacterium]
MQVHHILPKSLLYRQGYSRYEVSAIANFNFNFLAQDNLRVSNRNPSEYLEALEQK